MSRPYQAQVDARQAERKPRPPAQYRPVSGRTRFKHIPSLLEIQAIPTIPVTEFELTDKETRTLRSRLYAINRDGICRYRTLREGNITLVWRIA